jgi:hypothetical protein
MLSAIVSLATGYMEARAIGKAASVAEAWAYNFYRLIMGLAITTFCTFTGMWGLTGLACYAKGLSVWIALAVGFLTSLLTTAAVIANLWQKSELTKGIPIALPTQLENAVDAQNVTITTRN